MPPIRHLPFLAPLLCCCSLAAAEYDVSGMVQAKAPAGIYLENETPEFTLRPAEARRVAYRITDHTGQTVAQGQWPGDGRGTLRLSRLPRGYYQITLTGAPQDTYKNFADFGIVAVPPAEPPPDMPYSMDSAQSWCAVGSKRNTRFPGDGFEVVSEAARRIGLAWVRDRAAWAGMESESGKFQMQQYLPNSWMLSKRNIRVSSTYHDAPAHAKHNSRDLPDDLFRTYRFAKWIAAVGKGHIEAWEFWNEPDAGFTMEGAWDLAANLKAAGLGFEAGNPQARILNSSFCEYPLRRYTETAMKNDIAHYINTFNFHTYKPLREYPELISGLRKLLARHGVPELPIWITENGSTAPGEAKTPSYFPNLTAYTSEQEMVMTEFIPKAQITMQSLGVEKDFFFVLSPYSEVGIRDWGLLRKDYTARPGVFAFATLVHELGSARYLGPLELGAEVRAFLYEAPDGSQTVACWTLSDLDTHENDRIEVPARKLNRRTVSLPAAQTCRITDRLGRAVEAEPRNGRLTLELDRFPRYISGLSGLKPAAPAPSVGKPAMPATEADRTVVMRPILSEDFVLSSGRDSVDLKAASGRLRLQIWNLSDRPKSGTVSVSGGRAGGMPATITLPAFGKAEIPLLFTPDIPAGKYHGQMEFTGRFDGKPTTRLHVPLFLFGRSMAAGRQQKLDGIYRPERWRPNSSGKMEISYDKEEKAIRFDVEFPEHTDRWVYPEYVLQPGESFKKAKGVAFEIRNTPTMPKESIFMAVMDTEKERGEARFIRFPMPGTEWEERIVGFDEFVEHPEKIKMFRLGENPHQSKQTYWLRNLRILYGR